MLTATKRKALDEVDANHLLVQQMDVVSPHALKRRCNPSTFQLPMAEQQPTLFAGAFHGATTSPVADFLYGLARSTNGGMMGMFNEQTWCCFAELNLLCAANFSQLPASSLRGYHSYTRMHKDALWSRYVAGANVTGSVPPIATLDMHQQMVGFVLERVYSSYQEASIVKYTFKVPSWLLEWCQRWGLGTTTESTICVVAIHAYAPQHLGASGQEMPVRALYVPMPNALA